MYRFHDILYCQYSVGSIWSWPVGVCYNGCPCRQYVTGHVMVMKLQVCCLTIILTMCTCTCILQCTMVLLPCLPNYIYMYMHSVYVFNYPPVFFILGTVCFLFITEYSKKQSTQLWRSSQLPHLTKEGIGKLNVHINQNICICHFIRQQVLCFCGFSYIWIMICANIYCNNNSSAGKDIRDCPTARETESTLLNNWTCHIRQLKYESSFSLRKVAVTQNPSNQCQA